MNITFNQLKAHLAAKCALVYFIAYNDYFLFTRSSKQIKAAFKGKLGGDCEVFSYALNNKEEILDTIIQELKHQSLFNQSKIFEINLSTTKFDKTTQSKLQEIVALSDAQNLVIISANKLTIPKATWLTLIEERGVVLTIWPFKEHELPGFIATEAQALDLKLDARTIKYLLYKTEGDLLASVQELEKLSLQFSSNSQITVDDLKEHLTTSNNFDSFALLDLCLTGNVAKSLHVLNFLYDNKEELTLILWAMVQGLRDLYSIHHLMLSRNLSLSNAIAEQKIWTKRIPIFQSAMQRLSLVQITEALTKAYVIDKLIKSGDTTMAKLELTNLIMNITSSNTLSEA